MKKLHVKQGEQWLPVFCERQGQIVTCPDSPNKALPPMAMWADDDLRYFQSKYANREFALIKV